MIVFIIWLGLFPYILLYGAYEGPKVFWLWIGGFFLSIWWIIRTFRIHAIHISKSVVWFSLWLLTAAIASITGIHPWDSIIGGSYRHQGVLFFFSLLLVWLVLISMRQKFKPLLSTVLAWGAAAESLIIFWQAASDGYARPLGTFGEPNAVAGYLAISLFWMSHLRLKTFLRIIIGTFLCAAIVLTGSRTGIFAAIIMLIGMGWDRYRRLLRLYEKEIISLSIIAAIACVILVWKIGASKPASPYEDRSLFWQLGAEKILQRPLLGYGLESGEVVYDQAFRSINIKLGDFMVERSHNVFIDVAMWSGIIGLTFFIGWLIRGAKDMVARRDYPRMFAMAAWVFFAFFQPLGVVHWLLLIFLLSWV